MLNNPDHHRPLQLLLLDNYDSFTYNLHDYLQRLGASCQVIRNDEYPLTAFKNKTFDGLVLSPGPKKPSDAGVLMDLIAYFHDKKPILGICLGHQGIGEFFGATLVKSRVPVHGKTSVIYHNGHPLFQNLPPTLEVMRYHSLLLQDFAQTQLDIIAQTAAGEVMAITHRTLPIHGVQFHPESILTPSGLDILKNWLALVALPKNTKTSF